MFSAMKVIQALSMISTFAVVSLSIACAPSKQQEAQDLVREFNAKQDELSFVNQLLAKRYNVILYSEDPGFNYGQYLGQYASALGQTKDTDRKQIKILLFEQKQRVLRIEEIFKVKDIHLAPPDEKVLKTTYANAEEYSKAIDVFERRSKPRDPKAPLSGDEPAPKKEDIPAAPADETQPELKKEARRRAIKERVPKAKIVKAKSKGAPKKPSPEPNLFQWIGQAFEPQPAPKQ